MELQKDTVLKYVSPISDISAEITKQVSKIILKNTDISKDKLETVLEAVGVECVNKQGTYVKRIVKELKKQKKHLEPKTLSTIGNIIGTMADKNQVYYFDIYSVDRDKWWNSEQFGQSGGSCYWSDNRRVNLLGANPPFYALRFFNDADAEEKVGKDSTAIMRGHSRSWLRNYKDFSILFNGYGVPLLRQARLLSMYMGYSYEESHANNGGETDGLLYINNGGKSYIIATQEVIDRERIKSWTYNDANTKVFTIDFEVEEKSGDCECYFCGDGFHEDEMCHFDGRSMCQPCYDERVVVDDQENEQWKESCRYSDFHDEWILRHRCVLNDTVDDWFKIDESEVINKEYWPKSGITRKDDGSIWYDDTCIVEASVEEMAV